MALFFGTTGAIYRQFSHHTLLAAMALFAIGKAHDPLTWPLCATLFATEKG